MAASTQYHFAVYRLRHACASWCHTRTISTMRTAAATPMIAHRSHQYRPRDCSSPLRASLTGASWDTCYRLTAQVSPLSRTRGCGRTEPCGPALRVRYRHASTRSLRGPACGAQGRGVVLAPAPVVRRRGRGGVDVQAPRGDLRTGGARV